MGKKIVIKGADFSVNGFSLKIPQLVVKGYYYYQTQYNANSSRGFVGINIEDATIPFQNGFGCSAIEVPDGASSLSVNCNYKHSVLLYSLVDGVKTLLVDSGWRVANNPIVYDLTQYPTAFYVGVNIDAIGSVDVQDITFTVEFA